jgi:hypothetical protein
MRPKVYIETTIPSYLVSRASRDLLIAGHQQITRDWWDMRRNCFELVVSELVLQESSAGDSEVARRRLNILAGIPILINDSRIPKLAEALLSHRVLPLKAAVDAAHISIATVYGCEYLLTWNCRHIANAEIRRVAGRVAQKRIGRRARRQQMEKLAGLGRDRRVRYARVSQKFGFDLPVICTPEELMGEE